MAGGSRLIGGFVQEEEEGGGVQEIQKRQVWFGNIVGLRPSEAEIFCL